MERILLILLSVKYGHAKANPYLSQVNLSVGYSQIDEMPLF